ncbi:MAG TPA: acetylxylan esterase [Candidatus Binatia bacterium]|nr:acetylxylan esterase [Candidatus Binatia bacterium]
MARFDLSLDELRSYRPPRREPPDFDAFWGGTLTTSRELGATPRFHPVEVRLRTLLAWDVTFSGYLGQPIKAWLIAPRGARDGQPTIVEFVGYGGGRGLVYDWLDWASAGYVHFVMDTRGQGGVWLAGDTPDLDEGGAGPESPGVMTRGIRDPRTYYYRRLVTDAVLAVEAARRHHLVDPGRVIVAGQSQGGGLALAAAALAQPAAALVDVPFLCHVRRALEVTDRAPYDEIRRFLRVHPADEPAVFRTLAYVDGRNFAARATAPALFSVGLEDEVTPPSTVFAAYNEYLGPKEIRIWPYAGHDASGRAQWLEQLAFLARLGLEPEG